MISSNTHASYSLSRLSLSVRRLREFRLLNIDAFRPCRPENCTLRTQLLPHESLEVAILACVLT